MRKDINYLFLPRLLYIQRLPDNLYTIKLTINAFLINYKSGCNSLVIIGKYHE